MYIFYLYIDKSKENTKHEREYNSGRYIIKYAAKNFFNIKNDELEIINKKPKFKYSDIKFSISHTHNIVAVCFDDQPIGFDIELIKQRNYIKIAKYMNFKLKENTLDEFYKCWTQYEAEYKLQQPSVRILTQKFLDNYMMSIATTSEKNIDLNIYEIFK